jgi:putative redox protein
MKRARAVRKMGFTHTVEIRGGDHVLTADEPRNEGGHDEGPSPQELLAASLASCSAVTLEMYADRKGWNIGHVTVEVAYEPAQRGSPTRFNISVKLPKELPEEQRERLMQIVTRCPVHRTLDGEVIFDEKLVLI